MLQSQSLRCRDILAELSRKPEAEGGEPFDRLTVPALIEAAGAPHRLGHIQFILETDPVAGPPVPMIRPQPGNYPWPRQSHPERDCNLRVLALQYAPAGIWRR